MTDIPIYSKTGEHVDTLVIDDTIEYVNGRVVKGDKCYYKGAGVPYKSHNILNEELTDEYTVLEEGLVFYSGVMVEKACFKGKLVCSRRGMAVCSLTGLGHAVAGRSRYLRTYTMKMVSSIVI